MKKLKKSATSWQNVIEVPETSDVMDIDSETPEPVKAVVYTRLTEGVAVDSGPDKGSYHFSTFPRTLGGVMRTKEWAHTR